MLSVSIFHSVHLIILRHRPRLLDRIPLVLHSSKLAPQHLPLRIVVHGASKILTYGDTASGVVEVDTSSRTPHVTIRFMAKVTTQVYVPNGYRDKAKVYLFCHTLELYSGHNISSLAPVPGGFVSLPFSFTFPSEVQMAPSASRFQPFKESSVFEHLPGHPLPPTIYVEGGSGLPQTVEYFLEARMTTTSHSFFYLSGEKKVRHSLAFSPPCPDLSRASPPLEQNIVTLTRHSRWLYDGSPDEYHGFCSRMRDLISCSSDPTATFTVTTNVPTIARAGHPFPVTVRLAHIDRTDNLPGPPPVRLRAFRVTLKATTDYCVHKTQLNNKAHKSIEIMHQRYGTDTMILPPPLLPDGSELALAELCLGERTGPANDMPPTFKTYGLARSYAVKVVLWIECAGKTWELEAARFPIEMRPWLGAEAEEVPQMNGQGTEDLPPPPYEEVAPPYGL